MAKVIKKIQRTEDGQTDKYIVRVHGHDFLIENSTISLSNPTTKKEIDVDRHFAQFASETLEVFSGVVPNKEKLLADKVIETYGGRLISGVEIIEEEETEGIVY